MQEAFAEKWLADAFACVYVPQAAARRQFIQAAFPPRVDEASWLKTLLSIGGESLRPFRRYGGFTEPVAAKPGLLHPSHSSTNTRDFRLGFYIFTPRLLRWRSLSSNELSRH